MTVHYYNNICVYILIGSVCPFGNHVFSLLKPLISVHRGLLNIPRSKCIVDIRGVFAIVKHDNVRMLAYRSTVAAAKRLHAALIATRIF